MWPRVSGWALVALLVLVLACVGGVGGQQGTLKVGTCEVGYPPWVEKLSDGRWTGFEVDIWNAIFPLLVNRVFRTQNQDLIRMVGTIQAPFVPVPWDEMMKAAVDGDVDVLICGYYIVPSRAKLVDFLPPSLESGYHMVVPAVPKPIDGLTLLGKAFAVPEAFAIFALLLLVMLSIVYAHLIWIGERNSNEEIRLWYGPGVFDAWWLAIVTAVTVGYGEKTPVTYFGRIITVAWLVAGMYCVGLFGASLTSGLYEASVSTASYQSDVQAYTDMIGLRVGTYFEQADLVTRQFVPELPPLTIFPTIEECYDALVDGDVDVIVDDTYQAMHMLGQKQYLGRVMLTGDPFRPQHYGIVVGRRNGTHHPLYPHMWLAALDLLQGAYKTQSDAIRRRWFSQSQMNVDVLIQGAKENFDQSLFALNFKCAWALITVIGVWAVITVYQHRSLAFRHRDRARLLRALGCQELLDRYQVKKGAAALFVEWDTNRSNTLDLREITVALRRLGFQPKNLEDIVLREASLSGIPVHEEMLRRKDLSAYAIDINKSQFQTLMSRLVMEGFQEEAAQTLSMPATKTHVLQMLDDFRDKADLMEKKINYVIWRLRGGEKDPKVPRPPERGEEGHPIYAIDREVSVDVLVLENNSAGPKRRKQKRSSLVKFMDGQKRTSVVKFMDGMGFGGSFAHAASPEKEDSKPSQARRPSGSSQEDSKVSLRPGSRKSQESEV